MSTKPGQLHYGLRGERVKRAELEQLMADLPSDVKADGPEDETEADIARRIVDGEHGPRGIDERAVQIHPQADLVGGVRRR